MKNNMKITFLTGKNWELQRKYLTNYKKYKEFMSWISRIIVNPVLAKYDAATKHIHFVDIAKGIALNSEYPHHIMITIVADIPDEAKNELIVEFQKNEKRILDRYFVKLSESNPNYQYGIKTPEVFMLSIGGIYTNAPLESSEEQLVKLKESCGKAARKALQHHIERNLGRRVHRVIIMTDINSPDGAVMTSELIRQLEGFEVPFVNMKDIYLIPLQDGVVAYLFREGFVDLLEKAHIHVPKQISIEDIFSSMPDESD